MTEKFEAKEYSDLVRGILVYEELSGIEDVPGLESLLNDGRNLFVRNQDTLTEGLFKLESFADRFRTTTAYKSAISAVTVNTQIARQAKLFRTLFPKILNLSDFNDIFDNGIPAKNILETSKLFDEAEGPAFIHGLAKMRNATPGSPIGRWILRAAEAVGRPVSDMDVASSEVGDAKALGDEIKRLDAELAQTVPNDERYNTISSKKRKAQQKVSEIAKGPNAEAVMSAALSASAATGYATEIGKSLGLTPEQESAMMLRGKGIIAAGAGSGKTRVLAGKVVYHVKELNVPVSNIIATSFSRKSAHELKERIEAYGGSAIMDGTGAEDGFGTTHSIATKIITRNGGSHNVLKDYQLSMILKMAVAQVQMKPTRVTGSPNPNATLFPKPVAVEKETTITYLESLDFLYPRVQKMPRTDKWNPMGFLYSLKERGAYSELTPRMKEVYRRMLNQFRAPQVLEILQEEAALAENADAITKQASVNNDPKYYMNNPANQWFNLGLKREDLMDPQGRPISNKSFAMWITNRKGDMVAPDVAYLRDYSPMAAVYAAYEWIKNNDPANRGDDHDDTLLKPISMMIHNPNLLGSLRARYKVILVDEAQDLNRAQHVLFGLISGYLDPNTLEPYPNGGMTADTFCYIGDDKQCLEASSIISTPDGDRVLSSMKAGDTILSYRNGRVVPQILRHVVPSSWDYGYDVVTESGRVITMSPNHKLWVVTEDTSSKFIAHTSEGSVVKKEDGSEVVFDNYREALSLATDLWPYGFTNSLDFFGTRMNMTTAERLRENDGLACLDGSVDRIVSIHKVPGSFLDVDVDDASNLFASGILVSNSIYEFRAARPENFINKSNLVEGGEGFETKLLDTNFRSGSAIVEAANSLIQHNKKQVPMVCKSNPNRAGVGQISALNMADNEACAEYVANSVESLVKGENAPNVPKDFGVAVRTNAEAYAYGVEMLKRGIPFRSKMNFFANPTVLSIVSWLNIATETNPVELNKSILLAHKTPYFGLDITFEKNLERLAKNARASFYDFLVKMGGWSDIYGMTPSGSDQSWRNRKNVKPFADALHYIRTQGAGMSPRALVEEIMNMKGAEIRGEALSFVDSMMREVMEDEDMMQMLESESEDGIVTKEAIRNLAIAPISPLISLVEGYEDLSLCMSYIHSLMKAAEKDAKKDDPTDPDYKTGAVVIDTVHGWKGLEAKHMYVPMAKGTFPHARAVSESENGNADAMASERRLAYVALTRGQESVTVLCPMKSLSGKEAGPSEFVFEACIPFQGEYEMDSETEEMAKLASYTFEDWEI